MKNKRVKVFAPASVSNIGCGFDTIGFAIENPGDEIVLTKNNSRELRITAITGDNGLLPYDIENNTATVAMLKMIKELGIDFGVDVIINKKMAMGSGLGSSACSAVAGVVALNELLDDKLTKDQLLPFALAGEKIASKDIHADNVAPCLYGGFILIRGYDPIDIVHLKSPENLYCAVIHPQVVIKTSEAREMLPKNIDVKTAIKQWGNVGGLVAGICTSDYKLIGRSIEDFVAEPVRSKLIPGYEGMKKAAMDAGALGCNISGSGPSVFALCDDIEVAKRSAYAMQQVTDQLDIKSEVYVSPINTEGAKVIGEK